MVNQKDPRQKQGAAGELHSEIISEEAEYRTQPLAGWNPNPSAPQAGCVGLHKVGEGCPQNSFLIWNTGKEHTYFKALLLG